MVQAKNIPIIQFTIFFDAQEAVPGRQERDADACLQESVTRASLPKPGRGAGRRDVVTEPTLASRASRRQNFEFPARNLRRQRQRRAEVRPLGDRVGRLYSGLFLRLVLL